VARVVKADANAGSGAEQLAVFAGFDQWGHRLRVFSGVEGQRIGFGAGPAQPLVFSLRLHLLDVRAVQQKDVQEIGRRRRGVNCSAKTVGGHARQQSRMVDVGVGDKEEIHPRRIIRRDVQVASFDGIRALMHAAVNGKPRRPRFNDKTRPRDRSCGPEKLNFHKESSKAMSNERKVMSDE